MEQKEIEVSNNTKFAMNKDEIESAIQKKILENWNPILQVQQFGDEEVKHLREILNIERAHCKDIKGIIHHVLEACGGSGGDKTNGG